MFLIKNIDQLLNETGSDKPCQIHRACVDLLGLAALFIEACWLCFWASCWEGERVEDLDKPKT